MAACFDSFVFHSQNTASLSLVSSDTLHTTSSEGVVGQAEKQAIPRRKYIKKVSNVSYTFRTILLFFIVRGY